MDISRFYSTIKTSYPTYDDLTYKKLVNFQNHKDFPIHRWMKYREGYSVEIVHRVIKDLNIKGSVLDPFVGSGTTSYASSLLGLKSYGIELNPFPAFVAYAKTRKYSKKFIDKFEELLPSLIRKNKPARKPELKIIDKAFHRSVLESMLQVKSNINSLVDKLQRDLAFFIWLSILENVSNTFKEGNGIKYKGRFGYKRPPRKGTPSYGKYIEMLGKASDGDGWNVQDVYGVYSKRFHEIIEDLRIVNYKTWNEPDIILGDVRETEKLLKSTNNFSGVGLTIFSPPYANCFDYYEINKLELWMGDFIRNYEDFKEQRKKGLVSNLNTDLKNISYINSNLNYLLGQMNDKVLWDIRVKDMLKGYFRDMETTLREIYKVTNSKGYVVIVVANSSYGDIIVPTDILLAQVGEKIGFKVTKIVRARQTNTSSQQMKRFKDKKVDTSLLRESLVYLQKN